MNRQRFTIGDGDGNTTTVMLQSHLQHIWHTSEAFVSEAVLKRVEKTLGEGPYTNPEGNFGAAIYVHLVIDDTSE